MMAASSSILLSMLLMSITALFGQQPVVATCANRHENYVEERVSSSPTTYSLNLSDFQVVEAVEVTFVAPSLNDVQLRLIDDDLGYVPLAAIARYQSSSFADDKFILNTYRGRWGDEVRPSGYDFTPGIVMKLRVEMTPGCFHVIANDVELTCFNYRLHPDTVDRIQVRSDNAEIKSLNVIYSM